MADPFAPNSHDRLMREAQRGFMVVAVLMAVLAYLSFDRLFGRRNGLPEHVRRAPVAQTVWPYSQDQPDPAGRRAARKWERQSGTADDQSGNTTVVQGPENDLPIPASSSKRHLSDRSISEREPEFGEVHQASVHIDVPQSDDSTTSSQLKDRGDCNDESFLRSTHALPSTAIKTNSSMTSELPRPYKHDAGTRPVGAHQFDSRSQPGATMTTNLASVKPEPSGSNQPGKNMVSQPSPFNPNQQTAVQTSALDPFELTVDNPQPNSSGSLPPHPFADEPSRPLESKATTNSSEKKSLVKPAPSLDPPQPVLTAPAPTEALKPTCSSDPSSVADSECPSKSLTTISDGPNNSTNTSTKIHIVAAHESYYSISQQYYGDGAFFRALHFHNSTRLAAAEDPPVGSKIEIPSLQQLVSLYPQEIPYQSRAATLNQTHTSASGSTSSQFRAADRISHSPPALEATNLQHAISSSNDSVNRKTPWAAPETRIYLTAKGDTLFGIAANEMGQASRYLEIIELNRHSLPADITNATALPPNMTLHLPLAEN